MDLRETIKFVWKNNPEIIRDIICEECPEHIGEMERQAYLDREFEKGHKP